MRKGIGVLAFALVLGAAACGQAFFGDSPAATFFGEFKPVLGSWAEYVITPAGEAPATLRIAVVGQEGEHYWYEMVITAPEGDRVVTKMLVSGNPSEPENLERLIVKPGDQPAIEMPIELARMSPTGDAEVPEPVTVDKGKESVTVPAGTFEAQRWLYTQGESVSDVWVAEGIGPYGLIKTHSDEVELVLAAYGGDATTLITETPETFSMPGMSMRPPEGEAPAGAPSPGSPSTAPPSSAPPAVPPAGTPPDAPPGAEGGE